MHLRYVKFMYVVPLLSTIYRNRDIFVKANDAATKSIVLTDTRLADKSWLNAKNMVGRIRRAVEDDIVANNLPVSLGKMSRAWIESLSPESYTDWSAEKLAAGVKMVRFMLALETNPGVTIYCGGQALHYEVGSLFWINHYAIHSMVNFGIYSAVHLIADFAVEEGA
jgi:hypothetical protein